MGASVREPRGLAKGIVGSARVTAFGTSIVAPAASVITVLVIMVSYAGFAYPLVVLVTRLLRTPSPSPASRRFLLTCTGAGPLVSRE